MNRDFNVTYPKGGTAPTLSAEGFDGAHNTNGGGQPVVALEARCLRADGNGVMIAAVDFYNQTVSSDVSTQTLACTASTDKNKTGGVLIEWRR